MTRIVFSTDLDVPEDALGGKASNLVRLARAGFPVPRWFAVTTHAYRESLVAGTNANAPIQEAVVAEIIAAYEGTFRKGQDHLYVAVRSSAVGEDGLLSSFAGQMKTFLYVRGPEDLMVSVRGCWASAHSAGIAAYRAAHGLDASAIAVAVIVQEMVPSQTSGVLFTVNPISRNPNEIVIRAAYGLGEGVVADLVETDGYIVRGDVVEAEVADKTEMVVVDPKKGAGTVVAGVPRERSRLPCLSDDQARELARTSRAIAEAFGGPQDIEWAYAGDRLHILQTRPITTLGPEVSRPSILPGGALDPPQTLGASGREIVWDNSNITESYSGVTSALTFSFASNAYDIVYRQVCEFLGIPSAVIRANAAAYRNMLGLMKGRVFYNLKNWYRLLAMLPGFAANRGFMESMMGVREKSTEGASSLRGVLLSNPWPFVFIGWRVVRAFLDLDELVAAFMARFYATYDVQRKRDLAAMEPIEIVEMYDLLEREVLLHWKAPIVTDIFAMAFYGLVKTLCTKWCGDTAGSLQNDLLCGEGGIESTEPTKAIMRMAALVRKDPALIVVVADKTPRELVDWVRKTPSPLKEAFDDFLDRYGFRCMNELKLEEPSLRDDPGFIFAMIQNYMRKPDLDVGALEEREQRIRTEAEAKVRTMVRDPLRQSFFWWVLRNARKNVKNRENLRFARTKIFGLCREMFNAVGDKFHAAGLLDGPRDVYHLTVPEIWGYIEGRAVCTDLRGMAQLRKAEFDGYRGEDIPDRFKTLGMPYMNPMKDDAPVVPDDGDPNIMRGVSCCPGQVKGPVRVILSPKDDMRLDGQILVAERTDPGWVPLYPSAAGLLIERGSILSHSAIVARELGLPAIVGIKDLTKRIKDGDVVDMDARAGIVRLGGATVPVGNG